MEQPKPIDIDIPVMNGAIMYSMMSIDALMKLRSFIDNLIKWKALGNPVHVMTLSYILRPKEANNNDQVKT